MNKRVRLEDEESGGLYFTSEKKDLSFISSGCTIIDCILGGGYPLGRMTNIIGDKSTAKTALATEAVTNFLIKYPKGNARYCEAESAFDLGYAEAMGMPIKKVDFGNPEEPIVTIEDLYRDLDGFLTTGIKSKNPGIYVVDSFDGLTDEASLERDISKGSFEGTKPKQANKLFAHMHTKIKKSKVNLLIVSQVRQNMNAGVMGEKYRRSGGAGLDYYASQFLWLSHMGYIFVTKNKVKRPIGIKVKAKVKKNKVGLPFRDCVFYFMFGFGVDDIRSNLEYLEDTSRLKEVGLSKADITPYLKELENYSFEDYENERLEIAKVTKKVWKEVETTFLPKRRKYK